MAKLRNPLFSIDAHGSIGKIITYSKRKSGNQVRSYTKPQKPPSAKQRGQRRLTQFLVAQWQNMSDGDKATWATNAAASKLNLSGYHYFLREAQRDLYTHHGLCGYWHCNEIVDGQVLDISGNGYHCELMPSYPSNAPILVDSQKTKFGKALQYDGVDEYVRNISTPRLEFGTDIDFTIVAVVKMITGIANAAGLVTKAGPGQDEGFMIRHEVDGHIRFRLASVGVKDITALVDYRDKWVYIVAMCDRDSFMRLYIDNILKDSDTGFAETLNFNRWIVFGASKDAVPAKAIIDEVCIYNRVFSDGERNARYNFNY